MRKAFNQWLAWAQERQEYGTKLHLAVQVLLLTTCRHAVVPDACSAAAALFDLLESHTLAANVEQSCTVA